MKVAHVTYDGPMRTHVHRQTPSGTQYNFRGSGVDLTSVEDAKHFDRNSTFTVEWSELGALMQEYDDVLNAIEEAGYRQLQKMAGYFEDISGSGKKQEELRAELQEEAERLAEQMERQNR